MTRRASICIILGGIGISVYLTKTFENMKLQSQKLCYFKTSHTRNSNRIPHSHHRIHQEVLQIWWSKKNLQAARTFSKHPNNHTESPFIKWIKMSASRPQHEGLSGRNSHLYEPTCIFNSWHPSWHRDQMQCSKFFYDCNGWVVPPVNPIIGWKTYCTSQEHHQQPAHRWCQENWLTNRSMCPGFPLFLAR